MKEKQGEITEKRKEMPKLDFKISGVEINGEIEPGFESILTKDAIEFVVKLHRKFNDTRKQLLEDRSIRQKENKKGYSNYINGLRARYAFGDMVNNLKISIYTLEHIAKLYGFTSLRAFNRAFEKFLKIKPRDYLAQIKRQKKSGF